MMNKSGIRLPKPLFSPNGKRAVLLLHAYSGSSNDVRMLSRFLEKQNYTVYSPQFSGHATLNPEDILNQSTTQWHQDVLEALAFLKTKGYQQIAVLGLSMGGIFAMHALTEQLPEIVGGGCFCSPIAPVKNHVPENFLTYAQQLLSMTGQEPQIIQKRLIKIADRISDQLQDIEAVAATTFEHLHQIDCPTLIIQAGKDEMIDPEGVFQTVQHLKQVKLTFQWYPESGHVITIDKKHQIFEQDVFHFLETLPWDKE